LAGITNSIAVKNLNYILEGLKGIQAQPEIFLSCLRRFGAVGSAATLAFAGILAGILAAALSLAIILAFTGVLGCVGRVLANEKYAGPCGLRGRSGSIRLL
jgi:hypothetical protein